MSNKAIALAMPYAETFANEILSDPTLSGTVNTVTGLRATFGAMEWADEVHIGWRFEIDFKQQSAIT